MSLELLTNPRTRFNIEIAARAAISLRRRRSLAWPSRGQVHLFISLVDHFEPQVGRPARAAARGRLQDWLQRYPEIAARHRDAEGVTAVAISKDGKYFAFGRADGVLVLARMPLWIDSVSQSAGEITFHWQGGSGLYQMPELQDVRQVAVETPFGPPSDSFVVGELEGVTVAFLPRHGRGHRLLQRLVRPHSLQIELGLKDLYTN